jgi:opacity protein-like surface antigen
MPILRSLILSLVLIVVLTGPVWAEAVHVGYYAGLYAGSPILDDVSADDDLGKFTLDTDPGVFVSGTIGYDLSYSNRRGNGRFEIEYSYRTNEFSKAKFTDGSRSASGDLIVQSLMLSSYAVIQNDKIIQPYFGLGVGGAQVKVKNLKVSGQQMIDDDDLVFAAQAGCGLQMEVSPSLRLDLGYRFFYAHDPKVKEADGNKATLDYTAHTGMFGVVWMF